MLKAESTNAGKNSCIFIHCSEFCFEPSVICLLPIRYAKCALRFATSQFQISISNLKIPTSEFQLPTSINSHFRIPTSDFQHLSTNRNLQQFPSGVYILDRYLDQIFGFQLQTAGKRQIAFNHVFGEKNLVVISAFG